MAKTIGRNDPCPCGSGRKYKVCHGAAGVQPRTRFDRRRVQVAASDLMLAEPRFRIVYLVPHEEQDLSNAVPIYLYTPGVLETAYLLQTICQWPADIRELSAAPSDRLIHRVLRKIEPVIIPVEYPALQHLAQVMQRPFMVVVTNPHTRDAVADILRDLAFPILHVSTEATGDVVSLDAVNPRLLHDHAKQALAHYAEMDPAAASFCRSAAEILEYPLNEDRQAAVCSTYSNGLTAPNELALAAYGYQPGEDAHLEGKSPKAYLEAMLASAAAVEQARAELLPRQLHGQVRNRLMLTALSPAWILRRSKSNRRRLEGPDGEMYDSLFRQLIRQADYQLSLEVEEEWPDEGGFQHLMAHHRQEALSYVSGLAAFCARDMTPSVRLAPIINQVRSELIQLGGCARGNGPHRHFKMQKLFGRTGQAMLGHVHPRVLDVLERESARIEGIKLVADLPFELIPVAGLPLSLRFDCSRVPVTPGSLALMHQLSHAQTVLALSSFKEVLVVRSFANDDPCRLMLERAITLFQQDSNANVAVRIVDVGSGAELVDALNSFDGAIVVFDCHGHRDEEDEAGTIVIGGEPLHLYQYRTEVRVPPIALFSACDTLPLDGSHGSSSLGMLILGARAVLGTLLPINALAAAMFIARLIYRIEEFLPLAIRMSPGGVVWRSFLAGLIRMSHVTEVLLELLRLGRITIEQRNEIQLQANVTINRGDPAWSRIVEGEIRKIVGDSADGCLNQLTNSLIQVQVGEPESILIVDELPQTIYSEAMGIAIQE